MSGSATEAVSTPASGAPPAAVAPESSDPATTTVLTTPAKPTPETKVDDGKGNAGEAIDYTFTPPEGVEFDKAAIAWFTELAKAEKLPLDLARKLVDAQVKYQQSVQAGDQKRLNEQIAVNEKEALDEFQKDPQLGGANFDKTRDAVARAFQTFATKDEVAYIERVLLTDPETGKVIRLGNSPFVMRIFSRIAGAMKEETGGAIKPAGVGAGERSDEQKLKERYTHPTSQAALNKA